MTTKQPKQISSEK